MSPIPELCVRTLDEPRSYRQLTTVCLKAPSNRRAAPDDSGVTGARCASAVTSNSPAGPRIVLTARTPNGPHRPRRSQRGACGAQSAERRSRDETAVRDAVAARQQIDDLPSRDQQPCQRQARAFQPVEVETSTGCSQWPTGPGNDTRSIRVRVRPPERPALTFRPARSVVRVSHQRATGCIILTVRVEDLRRARPMRRFQRLDAEAGVHRVRQPPGQHVSDRPSFWCPRRKQRAPAINPTPPARTVTRSAGRHASRATGSALITSLAPGVAHPFRAAKLAAAGCAFARSGQLRRRAPRHRIPLPALSDLGPEPLAIVRASRAHGAGT